MTKEATKRLNLGANTQISVNIEILIIREEVFYEREAG